MAVPLSAVIITKNEAHQLERTVNSVAWCDEVLVLDSESTDGTPELAKSLGCQVVNQPFLGFGKQKRLAVELAKNDWVLVIDADEVVTDQLKVEIIQLLDVGPTKDGYLIPRQFIFLNHPMRFGGESGKFFLRLFNRQKGNHNEAEVHEVVEIKGSVGKLKGKLLHFSYASIALYWEKFNLYTSKGAKQLYERKKKKSSLYIAIRFPLTFLQYYLLKGLVFDGYPGFIWSLFSAMYPVVKYAKLKELNSKN